MKNWHSSAENWEIKANRPTNNGENAQNKGANPHQTQEKLCHIDAEEAFRIALERTYGAESDLYDDGWFL